MEQLFVRLSLLLLGVVVLAINAQQQPPKKEISIGSSLMMAEMKATLDALVIRVDSQATRIVKLEQQLAKANERIGRLMENDDEFSKSAATQQLIRPQSVQTQYRTCYEFYSTTLRNYKEIGFEDVPIKSGYYWIDVDGQGVGERPMYVHCNMTDGIITTSIGHDAEDEDDASGAVIAGQCSAAGCFSRDITYDASPSQLQSLIAMSDRCTQQIKINCVGVPLEYNGVQYAWWVDRRGSPRYFWSGNQSDAMTVGKSHGSNHTCQCGFDEVCVDPNHKCNCDSLAPTALTDSGIITDKDLLPVTRLHFGRTALPRTSIQLSLGRLECKGRHTNRSGNGDYKMPSNCDQLRSLGHRSSGFYLTKNNPSSSAVGENRSRIQTTYCDFTKTSGTKGYETVVGFNDIKTANGVYFYVGRNTNYNSNNTVIPYNIQQLNIGGAMNLKTGVFTAPVNGRYFFSFSAHSWTTTNEGNRIRLRVNGVIVGRSFSPEKQYNLPISATLDLKRGDQVDVFFYGGSLWDNNSFYTQFSGILLEEDLVI